MKRRGGFCYLQYTLKMKKCIADSLYCMRIVNHQPIKLAQTKNLPCHLIVFTLQFPLNMSQLTLCQEDFIEYLLPIYTRIFSKP